MWTKHFPRSAAFAGLTLLACAAGLQPALAQQASQPLPSQTPSDQEIIARIDAAVQQRSDNLAAYSVQETYSIYRNGEDKPSAVETVQTTFDHAAGKDYASVSHSGSGLLRNTVIAKVLAGEKEMSSAANRPGVLVTSTNYDMRPQPGVVDLNGHKCIVVDLTPKRKSPHLFIGKEWVDAADFTVIRLAGTPSESPFFFAGDTTVSRDYGKVDGLPMATHAEARSHSFLLGDTVMKIDYIGYKIDRSTTASAGSPPAPNPSSAQ